MGYKAVKNEVMIIVLRYPNVFEEKKLNNLQVIQAVCKLLKAALTILANI